MEGSQSQRMPRWLLVLILLGFGYHSMTLKISPMPWFDETYFASLTLHFIESGDFMADIGPMLESFYPQSKAYGPAYFLVTGFSIKVFGFGILQMRLPALIFGLLFLFVFDKILIVSEISRSVSNLAVCTLLFDAIFLQNIHSARMDSMALLLVGLGIYHLLKAMNKEATIDFLACGIYFGLAALTTPRIAVCLFGPGLIAATFFLSKPGKKRFLHLLCIPVLVFLLYSIWVFWGFGGYEAAYNYFFGQPKETLHFKSLADGYISAKKYIPPFQYPVLLIFTVFLITTFYFRRSTKWIFWISLVNLLAFYSLVNDTGMYSILAMPWLYMALACMAQSFSQMKFIETAIRVSMGCILLMYFGIFALKNTAIWLFAKSRDLEIAQAQVNQLMPRNSRVIGDEAFYYFVKKAGSDFQYLDRGAGTESRILYHQNDYNFQYILVRNPPQNQYEFNFYSSRIPLKPVGKINMPVPGSTAQNLSVLLGKLRIEVPKGYQGILYKR